MTNRNYKELLQKYWDGDTSIEEEKELKHYFRNNEDPESERLNALFSFFSNEQEITYTGAFKKNSTKIVKGNFLKRLSVAASIILVLGAGLFYYGYHSDAVTAGLAKGEIEDPEEALKITKEALSFLSVNYNKGQESVAGTIGNLEKLDIIKSN